MDEREKILQFMRLSGPILPVKVAKELNTNILMASAHLSELSDKHKVKISSVRVGGSPLYYLPGQEDQLQRFSDNLHEKEIKAYNQLKEQKIIYDKEAEPVIRVALRNINDFAKPLNVKFNNQDYLFWKWFLLKDEEANDLIKEKLIPGYKKKEEVKEEIKEKSKAAEDNSKEIKKEKPIEQEIKPKPIEKTIENKSEPKIKEKLPHQQKKEKPPKQEPIQKTLQPQEPINDEFYSEVESYFNSNNINILDSKLIRKNSESEFIVEISSAVGSLKYYCKAKSKKRINDGDLSSLFIEAQSKKLPPLLVIKGDLTKKAKEFLDKEFKGMAIKKI